jgi:cytochrome oxidase Cu insertion factor (SCO1/SenC/PrrC family)
MSKKLLVGLAVALAAALASSLTLADESAKDAEAKDKWASHKGDLPFIVGSKTGLEEAKFTGKPPMYFFTATW